jgi:glycosyltransferase involved in cell wall biosynthesis
MRQYDVGYFSSSDRGLECLLDMLPRIEEQLGSPVKAVWAYGWNSFDSMHAKNPDKMKWKWQMIRKMNDVGMESKGRLSHEDLAKLMKDTKVWAYPTEFTEIHCITALKAQEAGCIPVTTGCYALKETVGIEEPEVLDIYTNIEAQEAFISRVVEAIQAKDFQTKQVDNRYWPDVAKIWDEALA